MPGRPCVLIKVFSPTETSTKGGTDKINRKISRCVPERLFRSTGKQKESVP